MTARGTERPNLAPGTAALAIRDLRVELGQSKSRRTEVVKGISLDLVPGRIQGLAGESGSGKSMTAMAIPIGTRISSSSKPSTGTKSGMKSMGEMA